MDFDLMTDKAITEELGRRVKKLRLQKNASQMEVARFTGLSDKTIANAEQGAGTLLTYVKILRALDSLDALDKFLPDPGVSPIDLAKRRGRERQRASRKRT